MSHFGDLFHITFCEVSVGDSTPIYLGDVKHWDVETKPWCGGGPMAEDSEMGVSSSSWGYPLIAGWLREKKWMMVAGVV